MKKLFFTFIFAFSALLASAEIGVETVVNSVTGILYEAMAINDSGQADFFPVFVDRDYENKKLTMSIYGEDFNLIKKININGFSPYAWRTDIFESEAEVIVTKNWIVSNDKWCVILFQEIGGTDEYGNPLEKAILVDEDGNILGDYPFADYHYKILLSKVFSGKPYLSYYYRNDSGDDVYSIYQFTGSNSVETVKVAELKGYPNPLRSGQNFTVELPRVADNHTILVVTDMNGRQLERRQVEAGADSVVLHHSRLGRGQYIYTIIYSDGDTESGKLLAE